jgi:hypothetical protein
MMSLRALHHTVRGVAISYLACGFTAGPLILARSFAEKYLQFSANYGIILSRKQLLIKSGRFKYYCWLYL